MLVLQNIVLSGGSTMFKDFGRRLQRDLKRTVEARLQLSFDLSGGKLKVGRIQTGIGEIFGLSREGQPYLGHCSFQCGFCRGWGYFLEVLSIIWSPWRSGCETFFKESSPACTWWFLWWFLVVQFCCHLCPSPSLLPLPSPSFSPSLLMLLSSLTTCNAMLCGLVVPCWQAQ